MGTVYITADTHFGDDGSIRRYEGRPFQNGDEMNEALIANWNRVVGPEDTVYHLGDLVSGLGRQETEAIVKRLKGKKILIVDDVISTGESLSALEKLVEASGGIICGRMAILAEGDAQDREDLIYLEKLPLFNADGTVKV